MRERTTPKICSRSRLSLLRREEGDGWRGGREGEGGRGVGVRCGPAGGVPRFGSCCALERNSWESKAWTNAFLVLQQAAAAVNPPSSLSSFARLLVRKERWERKKERRRPLSIYSSVLLPLPSLSRTRRRRCRTGETEFRAPVVPRVNQGSSRAASRRISTRARG